MQRTARWACVPHHVTLTPGAPPTWCVAHKRTPSSSRVFSLYFFASLEFRKKKHAINVPKQIATRLSHQNVQGCSGLILTRMDLKRSPSRFGSLRFSGMEAMALRSLPAFGLFRSPLSPSQVEDSTLFDSARLHAEETQRANSPLSDFVQLHTSREPKKSTRRLGGVS